MTHGISFAAIDTGHLVTWKVKRKVRIGSWEAVLLGVRSYSSFLTPNPPPFPLLVFNINEVTLSESSICVSTVINTLLSKKAQVSLKCIKPQTLRQLRKPFDCEDEHALLPPSQHDRPTWHLTELVLFPYFMV